MHSHEWNNKRVHNMTVKMYNEWDGHQTSLKRKFLRKKWYLPTTTAAIDTCYTTLTMLCKLFTQKAWLCATQSCNLV